MDGVPSVVAADPLVVSERDHSPPPRLLFPDELEESRARPATPHRVARVAGYGLGGALALVGLFNVYETMASRAGRPGVPGAPAAAVAPLERLDRAADTLALAVGAFELRAGLFDRRQNGCPELAHGLIQVEEHWTAYNLARQAALVLDSARAARDRSQYSAVDAVERRFERSSCPRP